MAILLSAVFLLVGAAAGYLGQRSRMCFVGGFRDFLLVRDTALLQGLLSFLATAAVLVFVFRKTGLLAPHYPTLREAFFSTYALVSVVGGLLLGAAATLTGACPLRHHVLLGQGRLDSGIFFLGFYAGIFLYYRFIAVLLKSLY
jgi:uncharacterized protein